MTDAERDFWESAEEDAAAGGLNEAGVPDPIGTGADWEDDARDRWLDEAKT